MSNETGNNPNAIDESFPPRLAAELVGEMLNLLRSGDLEKWIELWHDDATMLFPYAPDGYTAKLEGRDAILAYMKNGQEKYFRNWSFNNVTIHTVADDVEADGHITDGAIAEFQGEADAIATGQRYRQSYVGFLTARDSKIACYREYWNPLPILAALGEDLPS